MIEYNENDARLGADIKELEPSPGEGVVGGGTTSPLVTETENLGQNTPKEEIVQPRAAFKTVQEVVNFLNGIKIKGKSLEDYIDSEGGVTEAELQETLTHYSKAVNIEDGVGGHSLQQKSSQASHVKGGTALGTNSVAFGVGDHYPLNVSGNSTTLLLIGENPNPNWENMVAEYKGEYRRIVGVNIDNDSITLESAFTSAPSGQYEINVVTQIAKGDTSFVWGEYNQAFGEGSMAGGIACKAVGNGAFACGFYSLVNQSYGIACGDHTISAGISQAVFGRWNNVNFEDLLIVGNGSQSGGRKDAFIVRADGRATVGEHPEEEYDVATKGYVDAYRFYKHQITITNSNDVEWVFIEYLPHSQAFSTVNDYAQFKANTDDLSTKAVGTILTPAMGVDLGGLYFLIIYNDGGLRIIQGNLGTRTTVKSFSDTIIEE